MVLEVWQLLVVAQVTVGTVEQLQVAGELNLRIIHDKQQRNAATTDDANPEVEAIKKHLKLYDEELSSPRLPVDVPASPLKSASSNSAASEQNLEDIEQVLIMDGLKDAFSKEAQKSLHHQHLKRSSASVSSTLYMSTGSRAENRERAMDYRSPVTMLASPGDPAADVPPNPNPFPAESNDGGQSDEPHWTQLNVQPPGSAQYAGQLAPGGSNRLAAELLEKISAQNVAEKGIPYTYLEPQENLDRQQQGLKTLATAYINEIANMQVECFCSKIQINMTEIKRFDCRPNESSLCRCDMANSRFGFQVSDEARNANETNEAAVQYSGGEDTFPVSFSEQAGSS